MLYSIWAIPPQPVYDQLKELIESLAKEYNAPTFEPHMTVLGAFEAEFEDIQQKVTQHAQITKPLELSLGPISISTTYFQSVFVRVNSTAQLMQLNLATKKMFDVENNVFMPHISLLYGVDEMREREETAQKISLPSVSFTVSELTIVPADPDPQKWEHLATIPFGS